MNVLTLYNSTQTFEPQYIKTNYRTTLGKQIYLQLTYDGIQSYVTKTKTFELQQTNSNHAHFTKVEKWKHIDPLENEQLYGQYPERFAVYRKRLVTTILSHIDLYEEVSHYAK